MAGFSGGPGREEAMTRWGAKGSMIGTIGSTEKTAAWKGGVGFRRCQRFLYTPPSQYAS